MSALFGLALTAVALGGWDGPEIQKVVVTKEGAGARVRVVGKDLAQPKFSRHNDGKAWIASFDAYLRTNPEYVSLKTPSVRYVQYGWYKAKPPVVNLLAWIEPSIKPDVRQDENGDWVIGLGVEAIPKAAATEAVPVIQPPAKPDTGAIAESAEKDVQGKAVTPGSRQGTSPKEKAQGVVEAVNSRQTPPAAKTTLQPRTAGTAVRAAQPTTASQGAGFQEGQGPFVSLDFTHTDVVQILKALALQTGTNIVTAPDVKGELTVSLYGETLKNALDLITRLAGYSYLHHGNTYIVGPPDFLEQWEPGAAVEPPPAEEVVTQFYDVKVANPEALVRTVQSVVQGVAASVGPSATMPKIILQGPVTLVMQAMRVLEEVDVGQPPPAPPEIVTETYTAKYTDTRDLLTYFEGESSLYPDVVVKLGPTSIAAPEALSGTRIAGPSGAGAAVGPGAPGGGGDEKAGQGPRSLVLFGPRESVERALGLLEQLDTPEPQVIIEVKVMDVFRSDLDKLGIKWDLFDNGIINLQNIERVSTTETINNVSDYSNRITDKVGNNVYDRGIGGGTDDTWTKTFDSLGDPIVQTFNLSLNPKSLIGSVNGFLDALVTLQRSKLLASPKVATLDGRKAEIFIGDDVLYVESSQVTTTGVTFQIGKVLAGIQLNAIPRISPDGFVTLALHPEVSLITAFNEVPGGGRLPQVARRFVDTVVRMRDGETLVIGGLIRQEEIEIMSRVPILGDLPILGQLFRHRSKSAQESEVVIFLTVRIAD